MLITDLAEKDLLPANSVAPSKLITLKGGELYFFLEDFVIQSLLQKIYNKKRCNPLFYKEFCNFWYGTEH